MAKRHTGTPKEGYEVKKGDEDIIQEAIAFYKEDYEAEMLTRKEMREDKMFEIGGRFQWDSADYERRTENTKYRRPAMTVDRIQEFLNHLKNEMRQNKPSITVTAAGAKSEEVQKKRIKYAENRQGMIRAIQYDSKAAQAYQKAYDDAVGPGRGFFIIETEYVSPRSFDMKIVINRIENPENVVCDRNRKTPDYRDMKRAFITERYPRERFKTEFPDAEPYNWQTNSYMDYWVTKDDIMVANYYCVRARKRTLLQLDGEEDPIYEDELAQFPDEDAAMIKSLVIGKRTVKDPYVKCYKMTAHQILAEFDILGSRIPIIPVVCREDHDGGLIYIQGITRKLKDPQKLYNFYASTEAELLSLAPKAPYTAAMGQISKYMKIWENLNTEARAVLPYDPIAIGGTMVPAPQRTDFAPVPTGLVNGKAGIIDDMRAITGMHAPSLGMEGRAKSGRAIIAEQQAGDTSNYHLIDNMGISIESAGLIINDWLGSVYTGNRIEKILGDEDREDTLRLGDVDEDGDVIGFGDGEFSVVVTMGPSYTTKRQHAAESMLQFMQAVPNVVPLIYDLLVKNMDWPGAQEIADRLRKTIPPEILEEQGGENAMAAQLQQMMMQVKQYEELIPMLSQQLEKAMAELDDKGAEISKDLEVAQIKAATDIAVANIRANTERQKTFTNALTSVRKQQPANQGA